MKKSNQIYQQIWVEVTGIIAGNIKKLQSISIYENNVQIKKSEIFFIYLMSLYINKVITQYLQIIDSFNNNELFEQNLQSQIKNNTLINNLIANQPDVRDYVQSPLEIKLIIIKANIDGFINAVVAY